MTKKCIVYARVSTDEQARTGYSLDSQIEACLDYAHKNGLKVIEKITDDFTGSSLDRPGLDRARAMINVKEIQAIVVFSSDRWTRNLAHSLILREELLNAGVELHYVNRGKSEDTPESRMLENIEGVFNEYWREKIVEACRRGKNAKAKDNRPVLIGVPTYGYRKEGEKKKAKLVVYEQEARIVRDIFEWYINGRDGSGPLSLMEIAGVLNRLNVPTAQTKKNCAKVWYPNTIRGILSNEIYVGRTYYGKIRVINKKRVKQPRERWIPIEVPDLAIIDQSLFDAVQSRAKRNAEKAKRNRRRKYLLAGHFYCGSCGYAMVGNCKHPNTYSIMIYRCGGYTRRHMRKCDIGNRYVYLDVVDGLVWSWLDNLISDDDALRQGIRKMTERSEMELKPLRERLELVNNLIDARDAKIKRLMDQFGDTDNQTILSALNEEINKAAKEKESLLVERQTLEVDLAQRAVPIELEEQIIRVANEIRGELADPDYETKRYILDRLNVQVELHQDGEDRWLWARCSIMPEGVVLNLEAIQNLQESSLGKAYQEVQESQETESIVKSPL